MDTDLRMRVQGPVLNRLHCDDTRKTSCPTTILHEHETGTKLLENVSLLVRRRNDDDDDDCLPTKSPLFVQSFVRDKQEEHVLSCFVVVFGPLAGEIDPDQKD